MRGHGRRHVLHRGQKAVKLKLDAPQPEKQKNGYNIYRIDGNVTYAGENYKFELQIKSLVNSFWSEIEHKLIYKNNRLNQFDNLMKEMLDSTHESLSGIDHQLSLIFDRVSGNTISNQHEQLKSMIAMGLNEMYTAIVKANTGIPVSITEYSEAIVDYLITASSYTNEMTGEPLIKTIAANMSKALGANTDIDEHRRRFEYGDNYSGMLFSLMKWMRDIDYSTIAIGENIALDVTLDGVEGEVDKNLPERNKLRFLPEHLFPYILFARTRKRRTGFYGLHTLLCRHRHGGQNAGTDLPHSRPPVRTARVQTPAHRNNQNACANKIAHGEYYESHTVKRKPARKRLHARRARRNSRVA